MVMNPWRDRILERMIQPDMPLFTPASGFYHLAGAGYLHHEGIDGALEELIFEGRLIKNSYGYGFRFPLREYPREAINWIDVEVTGSPYHTQLSTTSGKYRHRYVGALRSGISGDTSAVVRPTTTETWHDGWPPEDSWGKVG